MSNTPGFVAHALDLLAPLGAVSARPMFGGHGLYARGVMFGLLDDEELFLRADDEARPAFVAAGCRQWSYPTKGRRQPGDYWRPPDEAHEDPEAMQPWAELGLAAALRRAAGKAARAGARAGREKPARPKGAPRVKGAAKVKPAAKAKGANRRGHAARATAKASGKAPRRR
ncbi:MAG: TfoX/Sxy family protein [Anaeromyxobacteraceae bacterium]|nr:TfoX/Sxy family protein [Anaeromyxobacteraceae bacterium]